MLSVFQLAESDGEFDSLDNCSEGGMSAENFNTLKKGHTPFLVPIDPPPEFKDSPQTTLLRSNAFQEFAHKLIKDILGEAFLSMEIGPSPQFDYTKSIQRHAGLYSSDSRLHGLDQNPILVENIYDDPSDSTRNSDDIEVDYYLSKQPPFNKRSYDKKRNASACGQHLIRPNSRNSLQSRLSSSHNSLTITRSNKADDSIFITQAMSHDALLGQGIIDFYNVPLDSDIYALPCDHMVVVESSSAPHPDLNTIENTIKKRLKQFPPKTTVSSSVEGKKKFFRKEKRVRIKIVMMIMISPALIYN